MKDQDNTAEQVQKDPRIEKAATWNEMSGQFYGSMEFHKILFGGLLTEGTKAMGLTLDCFWLFDIIMSVQFEPKIRAEEFQVWEIFTNLESSTARVLCTDGNSEAKGEDRFNDTDHVLYVQDIPYTDFPLQHYTLYAQRNEMNGITIMLTSEY